MIEKHNSILANLDELIVVFITDNKGNLISSYEKKSININYNKIVGIVIDTIDYFLKGSHSKDNELVIFFEKATCYFRLLGEKIILILLNTPKPSPLSCLVIKDFIKKIEAEFKQSEAKTIADTSKDYGLIQLSVFTPVVDTLSRYYGPAAKLMVKKALKNAGATNDGIQKSSVRSFLNNIENEIMDMNLRTKIMNELKNLLIEYT